MFSFVSSCSALVFSYRAEIQVDNILVKNVNTNCGFKGPKRAKEKFWFAKWEMGFVFFLDWENWI